MASRESPNSPLGEAGLRLGALRLELGPMLVEAVASLEHLEGSAFGVERPDLAGSA
jgi:hypothetical protein